MRTAKVLVTDLGGKSNKIFHSGDTVSENNFPEGNFDKLIAGGFIKENVEAKKEKIEAPVTGNTGMGSTGTSGTTGSTSLGNANNNTEPGKSSKKK